MQICLRETNSLSVECFKNRLDLLTQDGLCFVLISSALFNANIYVGCLPYVLPQISWRPYGEEK